MSCRRQRGPCRPCVRPARMRQRPWASWSRCATGWPASLCELRAADGLAPGCPRRAIPCDGRGAAQRPLRRGHQHRRGRRRGRDQPAPVAGGVPQGAWPVAPRLSDPVAAGARASVPDGDVAGPQRHRGRAAGRLWPSWAIPRHLSWPVRPPALGEPADARLNAATAPAAAAGQVVLRPPAFRPRTGPPDPARAVHQARGAATPSFPASAHGECAAATSLLQKVRLDHLFNRVPGLAQGGRDRFHPHRAAAIVLGQKPQISAGRPRPAPGDRRPAASGRGRRCPRQHAVALDQDEIHHPAEETTGNPGRAACPARDLAAPLGLGPHAEKTRAPGLRSHAARPRCKTATAWECRMRSRSGVVKRPSRVVAPTSVKGCRSIRTVRAAGPRRSRGRARNPPSPDRAPLPPPG